MSLRRLVGEPQPPLHALMNQNVDVAALDCADFALRTSETFLSARAATSPL